jgi:hypothetical protein
MRHIVDNGQIVCIGPKRSRTGKRGPSQQVLIQWTPYGHELELREHVQSTTSERMWVLAVAFATLREVERFRAKHNKSREFGHWFKRTDALIRDMAALVRSEYRATREQPLRQAA